MSEYESTADLNEAHYYAGLDADTEMAGFMAEAAESRALRKRGICTHGSGLGGGVDFYSAEDIVAMLARGNFGNRGGFVGAQTDIPAGKTLCTECGDLIPAW